MRTPSVISAALCALLLTATPARAEYECSTAYVLASLINNDWEAAYQACLPLAEQGDAAAQATLGEMYRKGKGVPKDYAQAVRWFRKAAEQGYAVAQYGLGLMYHEGKGLCASCELVSQSR